MEAWLIDNLTFQNVILVCIALYFFFPKIKRMILRDKEIVDNDADLAKRVATLEGDIADIKKKVGKDFYDIQDIKQQTKDSLEERAILMRSTLAILKGLQEIGANGPTKEAQKEIEDYLTRKAHE